MGPDQINVTTRSFLAPFWPEPTKINSCRRLHIWLNFDFLLKPRLPCVGWVFSLWTLAGVSNNTDYFYGHITCKNRFPVTVFVVSSKARDDLELAICRSKHYCQEVHMGILWWWNKPINVKSGSHAVILILDWAWLHDFACPDNLHSHACIYTHTHTHMPVREFKNLIFQIASSTMVTLKQGQGQQTLSHVHPEKQCWTNQLSS